MFSKYYSPIFAGPGLHRTVDLEKAGVDAQQRVERLEFDLNETTKVLQVRNMWSQPLRLGQVTENRRGHQSMQCSVPQRRVKRSKIADRHAILLQNGRISWTRTKATLPLLPHTVSLIGYDVTMLFSPDAFSGKG